MGMIGTRINDKLDKSFRQLCEQRGLTMTQGLTKLVEEFVDSGLSEGMLKADIKAEAKMMLTSVATIEEKIEKVRQLKEEIAKLAEKPFSREHVRSLGELYFYDETLVKRIKHLRSELNILLQEIETDQKTSKGKLKTDSAKTV